MITKFKIFESWNSTASDLINQFDDDYIEEYYAKNHKIGLDEIISMSSHENIMNYFDGDKYKKDWISDYISGYNFNDFDKDDLKKYIKKNIDETIENNILEIYNKNNYDEDDEDSEKETEFSYYMLNDLDKEELQEVIKDSRKEDNCTEWLINGWYSNQDGEDLFDEFCGWTKENGYYGNKEYGSFEKIENSEFYNRVSKYIDDDKLKNDWDDGTEFNSKKESVENDIYNSKILQRYLIEKDPDNADALIDLWKENKFKSDNIGSEYNFQIAYINKYIKDNMYDDGTEEDRESLIEDSLVYLQGKFGLDYKTRIKYKPYMWKVTAEFKFNI